jgi:hypothetical protein
LPGLIEGKQNDGKRKMTESQTEEKTKKRNQRKAVGIQEQ